MVHIMKTFIDNRRKSTGSNPLNTTTLEKSETLEQLKLSLLEQLQKIKKEKKVIYVSGIITSEGEQNIKGNIEELKKYVNHIRNTTKSSVFAASDVITEKILDNFAESNYTEKDYRKFWREIINSNLIDKIIMTPKWFKSIGAKEEYIVAKVNKIKVTFLQSCDSEIFQ